METKRKSVYRAPSPQMCEAQEIREFIAHVVKAKPRPVYVEDIVGHLRRIRYKDKYYGWDKVTVSRYLNMAAKYGLLDGGYLFEEHFYDKPHWNIKRSRYYYWWPESYLVDDRDIKTRCRITKRGLRN